MKKLDLVVLTAAALGALALSSCNSTGQGAGIGAATGAAVGAAATGDARGAAIGAGIGAGTGALIGAAIEADERGYYEGRVVSYYPFGRRTGRVGFLRSPYRPYAIVDVRGIPRGALVRDPASGRIFRRP